MTNLFKFVFVKWIMKFQKKLICFPMLLFLFLGLVFSPLTYAEWSGKSKQYVSDVYIKHVATGQINGGAYVCVSLYRDNDKITNACSLSTGHMWSASYETLYNQAMYYYTTGQKIRVYYLNIGAFYPDFSREYGGNLLTGFATCESDNCFGPAN